MFITLSDNLAHGIEEVCTISADLSGLSGALKQCLGLNGTYWELNYDIGIQFGGTEVQVYLKWTEDVRASVSKFSAPLMPYYAQGECKSRAQIIPNSLM